MYDDQIYVLQGGEDSYDALNVGHFLQKSHYFCGSLRKIANKDRESYGSSPPYVCMLSICIYVYITYMYVSCDIYKYES